MASLTQPGLGLSKRAYLSSFHPVNAAHLRHHRRSARSTWPQVAQRSLARQILSDPNLEGEPLKFLDVSEKYWKVRRIQLLADTSACSQEPWSPSAACRPAVPPALPVRVVHLGAAMHQARCYALSVLHAPPYRSCTTTFQSSSCTDLEPAERLVMPTPC
jgi:hypothetical protein